MNALIPRSAAYATPSFSVTKDEIDDDREYLGPPSGAPGTGSASASNMARARRDLRSAAAQMLRDAGFSADVARAASVDFDRLVPEAIDYLTHTSDTLTRAVEAWGQANVPILMDFARRIAGGETHPSGWEPSDERYGNDVDQQTTGQGGQQTTAPGDQQGSGQQGGDQSGPGLIGSIADSLGVSTSTVVIGGSIVAVTIAKKLFS